MQETRPHSSPAQYPLRIGRPEEFSRLRQFFQACSFDDITVCRTLAITDMGRLGSVAWDTIRFDSTPVALRWCIETFLQDLPPSEERSRAICGEEVFAAFVSLGVLRTAKQNPANLVSAVLLHPVAGFVVVADRPDDPDGGPFTPMEDIVFPATSAGSLQLVRFLPETRDGEALDLCGGSGIGALHLSRTARTALTADVTERAAHFAEFNARLNDAPIRSLCGDLYAPVMGKQFDLISAHPPYVPAMCTKMIWRDAGDTGEDITRRIIEGLPDYLRPGGTCVITCVARDTETKPFEQRARDWLGPSGTEFDVIFGLEKAMPLEEVAGNLQERWLADGHQPEELLARLRALDTRQFVNGILILRRCGDPVPEPPARVRLSETARAIDFDRLFAWRRRWRRPGWRKWLAGSRPRVAAEMQLNSAGATPIFRSTSEVVVSTTKGFDAALRLDAWTASQISRLDGTRTVREVFSATRRAGATPAGFTLNTFGDLVRQMIDRGFLDVELPHD